MANHLIDRMRKGDKKAIVDSLSHSGAIYRMNAIAFCAIWKMKDPEVENRIKELKEDDVALDGYRVSDFAFAALDLMGIEAYTGNRIFINNLIASKFEFLL